MNTRRGMSESVDVLASAVAFCDLVAAARFHKFPGSWSGSAYRSHPCGVIQGTIKLTNHRTTSKRCSISITDGEGWSDDYGTNPMGGQDPHPKPIKGSEVVVWSNGRWTPGMFQEILEPTVRNLLDRMAKHVADAESAERERRDTERKAAAERRAAVEAAALARVQGVSA